MVSVGAVLAGIFLARIFPHDDDRAIPPGRVATTFKTASDAKPGSVKSLLTGSTDDKTLLMRRTVAKCETAGLWEWLRLSHAEGGPWLDIVTMELIDREGWQAWSFVRSLEEDHQRGNLSEHILAKLAERDPWKAYEVWKKSRADFGNPHWGSGVLDFVTIAATTTSGEKLVEVLQQMTVEESESLMTLEFARGFDFQIVLDYLVKAEQVPLTVPGNLLPEWAEQSPAEAAAWLVDHPGYREVEHQEYASNHTIEVIASGKGSIDERHAALEVVSKMPADFLDRAWEVIGGNSGGKIDPETLDSASYLKRREPYLAQALLQTKTADTIDDSWNQVPLEERRGLLEQADNAWKQKHVSPVENRVHQHWRERVTTAWGITPWSRSSPGTTPSPSVRNPCRRAGGSRRAGSPTTSRPFPGGAGSPSRASRRGPAARRRGGTRRTR
jgi:hypothetical protein